MVNARNLGAAAATAVILNGCAALIPAPPPQPFACAGPQAPFSRNDIGPGGGAVRLQGHELRIPAGVLDQTYTFVIEPEPTDEIRLNIYAQGASSFTFDAPVFLTLSYERCDDEPGDLLQIYRRLPAGGWEYLNGRRIEGRRAVQTRIDGLSIYELADP